MSFLVGKQGNGKSRTILASSPPAHEQGRWEARGVFEVCDLMCVGQRMPVIRVILPLSMGLKVLCLCLGFATKKGQKGPVKGTTMGFKIRACWGFRSVRFTGGGTNLMARDVPAVSKRQTKDFQFKCRVNVLRRCCYLRCQTVVWNKSASSLPVGTVGICTCGSFLSKQESSFSTSLVGPAARVGADPSAQVVLWWSSVLAQGCIHSPDPGLEHSGCRRGWMQ